MIIAEHGSEVGRAGGEHSTMAGELASLHADHNISEEATVAKLIEDLQNAL